MNELSTSVLSHFEKFAGQNDLQKQAWEDVSSLGLPTKKSEAYKFTPITTLIGKALDGGQHPGKVESKIEFIEEEGSHLVIINGQLDPKHSQISEDLKVSSNAVSEGKNDPFSLLNQACAPQQIEIKVNSNQSVYLYHFSDQTISSPRIKVDVAANAEVDFVETFSDKSGALVTNSYIEFSVNQNAKCTHSKVQAYTSGNVHHETCFAHVAKDGKFFNNTFSFDGKAVRNNLTINLEDENSEGYMYGAFILDSNSHVDNNTSVDHLVPNCYSNELYKGILDEKSTGVFNGKIYVRKDAQKTNAFQANNNILLSNDATLHTKPQLEIWADDVKCSHGCTSGQLDEDAVFYLRARGISEKEAKGMILNAFAKESMEYVNSESLKQQIIELIQEKLV